MEEGGKLEEEKGGQVEQLLWYCVITQGLNTPYTWESETKPGRSGLSSKQQSTTLKPLLVCSRAKNPTDTSSCSLSLIRKGESVFIERRKHPLTEKINRFTVLG